MITALDVQSWSKELVTGNAEFVEITTTSPPTQTLYIVSNVRQDNSFVILKSDPVPPAAGPGASFGATPPNNVPVATYTFPQPNSDFDPVVALDPATGLLHIIGTQNNPTNSSLSDLIKFTFDTNTNILSGPVILTSASAVRSGYDITILSDSHRVVAVNLIDATMQGSEIPPLFQAVVTDVTITQPGSPPQTTLTITCNNTFHVGELVTFTGLTNATFLNGLTVQVLNIITSGSPPTQTDFIAAINYVGTYSAPEVSPTALATPFYSGENLIAFELDTSDNYVTNSLFIVASSPDRSGNTYSSVSLINPSGTDVELYYGEHPKTYTFKDQLFTINLIKRTTTVSPPSTAWGSSSALFAYTARFADDSLTVIPDALGNRYLSQTFWTQSDHPEGIIGNVVLGTLQLTSPPTPWLFSPVYGSTTSGSIVQSTLSVTLSGTVNLVYLLEPFNQVNPLPATGTTPAYPLYVASVNPTTLGVTNAAGFYNSKVFTWLRGTKSLVDDGSVWAVAGETADLTTVTNEAHTIPASGVVQVDHFSDTPVSNFWENIGVIYTLTSVPLMQVSSNPAVGQYVVEPTNGRYVFNLGDFGQPVGVSYSYVSAITPIYASLFNVPPIVAVTPTTDPTIVYRQTPTNTPLTISAAGTVDPDQDPIEYFWSENDPNTFDVTLTPNGNTAVLNVSPLVGGAQRDFTVGVSASDLFPDGITLRHPPLNVTSFSLSGSVATFTVTNTLVGSPPVGIPVLPLAVGEKLMTYGFGTLYEFLNDQELLVIGIPAPTSSAFSANINLALSPPVGPTLSPPIGVISFSPPYPSAMPAFQYGLVQIEVPFNSPPTIFGPPPVWDETSSPPAEAFTLTSPPTAARNTQVTITPSAITDPLTQYPVVYGGISDPDDVVSYNWFQVSGTPVTVVGSSNSPALTFATNGANVAGENLVFELVLNDGVNVQATATFTVPVATYAFPPAWNTQAALSRSVFSGNISQRNETGTWGVVDISALYSNLYSIKRNSVNDGSDRYIVISPSSVLLYGGVTPTTVLLRVLLTPNQTAIVDAVHTEADYTLVIDDSGNLFRYGAAALIFTDNPDTAISLLDITSTPFDRILTTYSFANQRVILLGGPSGCVLLQVNSTTLEISGFLELSTASNLLYGANNIQFIRYASVESLRSGQVLIGSILNSSAPITGVEITDNTLTVTSANTFMIGDRVILSGLTGASFLNGRNLMIISATDILFQASLPYGGNYGTTFALPSVAASNGESAVYSGTITGGANNAFAGKAATILGFENPQNNGTFICLASTAISLTFNNPQAVAETAAVDSPPASPTVTITLADTGSAQATNDGQTYETLVDLAHGQIIGTWNASKLKNQFVNTGEILFDAISPYSGFPLAPVQKTPTSVITLNGIIVTVSWVQQRPDLVTSYNVQYSTDGINYSQLQFVGSGSIQSVSVELAAGNTYYFQIQAISLDGTSNFSNVASITI